MKESAIRQLVEFYHINPRKDVPKLRLIKQQLDESSDFTACICGLNLRFISEQVIDSIMIEEISDDYNDRTTNFRDKYLNLRGVSDYVEIDWKQTVDNIVTSSGYDPFFSTDNDSCELKHDGETYYVFNIGD